MLTWNRLSFVEKSIESFYSNVGSHNHKFYIIDNGSNDGTVVYLKAASRKFPNSELVYNNSNSGLQEFKTLFNKCKEGYIIILDDDVIEFPPKFDLKLVNAFETFTSVGFLSLDVVQNDLTNGAKPAEEFYRTFAKYGIEIDFGSSGGWCKIFRVKDYKKIKLLFNLIKLSMVSGEDGTLVRLMKFVYF